MKIGLIDMDNISKKRVSFPNLPLMKLSAYHKKHGDCVDWWLALENMILFIKAKSLTSRRKLNTRFMRIAWLKAVRAMGWIIICRTKWNT